MMNTLHLEDGSTIEQIFRIAVNSLIKWYINQTYDIRKNNFPINFHLLLFLYNKKVTMTPPYQNM